MAIKQSDIKGPRNLTQKLDRLRKRHGYTGEKLNDITEKIMEFNGEKISRRVARLTKKETDDKLKKIKRKKPGQRIVTPEIEDIFPGKSVFTRKSVERGELISDELRSKISRNLQDAMKSKGIIYKRGINAGRIRQDLVEEFKKEINKTFANYAQKDPKIGVPPNVHGIAVTEVRSAANQIKKEYISQVANKNDLATTKTWIQNKSLAKEPRAGHSVVHRKTIPFDEKFRVPLVDHNGKVVSITEMDHPHDPTAPPGQVIGCNCDIEYSVEG